MQLRMCLENREFEKISSLVNAGKIEAADLRQLVSKDYSSDLSNPHLQSLFEFFFQKNEIVKIRMDAIIDMLREVSAMEKNHESVKIVLLRLLKNSSEEKSSMILDIASAFYNAGAAKYIIENIPDNLRQNTIHAMIRNGIYKCNIDVIEHIKNNFPDQFDLAKIALNKSELTKMDKLISFEKGRAIEIAKMEDEFVNGPGRISYQGGLLTCARINQLSDKSFYPTLLPYDYENNKIEKVVHEYLECLKGAPLPIKELIIFTGKHWMCGQMSVDKDGNASFMLIDPLGWDDGYKLVAMYEVIKRFYPECEIYVASEKRQNRLAGCSAFALDDARILSKLERYLGHQYGNDPLFGYVSEHVIETVLIKLKKHTNLAISECHLPATFLRSMQSRGFFDIYKSRSEEEKTLKINKRGNTVEDSANKSFVNNVNTRIARKLEHNMALKNGDYLLEYEMSIIKEKMQEFTFQGFKNRMAQLSHPLLLPASNRK